MRKTLLFALLILFIPIYVRAESCPPQFMITLDKAQYNINENIILTLKDQTVPICTIGSKCWKGYKNATSYLPDNITNSSNGANWLFVNLGASTTQYPFTIKSNSTGNYTISFELVNITQPNNNCTVNISFLLGFPPPPNITLSISALPSQLVLYNNYTFNVTYINTGNGTAFNISGSLGCLNVGECVINQSIFVSDLTNNTNRTVEYSLYPTIWGNLTLESSVLSYYLSDNITKRRISDPSNFFVTNAQFNFTVISPPMITVLKNITLKSNNNLSINLDTSNAFFYFSNDDKDRPYPDRINWTFNMTTNVKINFDNSSHQFNISPVGTFTGIEDFLVNATDSDNLSTLQVITVFVENATSEICNGIDDDGDTLIDENAANTGNYTVYCTSDGSTKMCINGMIAACPSSLGGGHSNTGSGGTTINAFLTITSPKSGDIFRVRQFVSAKVDSAGVYSYEWTFGDGETDDSQSTSHAYDSPGTYSVKCTGTSGYGLISDSVSVKVVECFSAADCTNSLCCNGLCIQPNCTTTCPIITGKESLGCLNPNTCEATCSYRICSKIACYNETDCDDKDDGTYDECLNPGQCIAQCKNSEVSVSIIEPSQGDTFESSSVQVKYETTRPVKCSFQLNNGNTQSVWDYKFKVNAKIGMNLVKVMCGTSSDSVAFYYKPQVENVTVPKTEIIKEMLDESQLLNMSKEEIESALDGIKNAVGLEVTRLLKVQDGKSLITLQLKNPKIIDMKNILIDENIPKNLALTADWITSTIPYKILEADPRLGFMIGYLKAEDTKEVFYLINQSITEEDLKLITSNISAEEVEGQMLKIQNLQEATQNVTKITQKVTKKDGNTEIITSIDPTRRLKNVKVYLLIPKCMAEKVKDIKFKDENFKIITDDPLVMWQFDEINRKVDLLYELKKDVPEWCWKQIKIIPIAEEVGDEITGPPTPTIWTIIPILIVPIIALLLIFFSRFAPEEKKKVLTTIHVRGQKVHIRR